MKPLLEKLYCSQCGNRLTIKMEGVDYDEFTGKKKSWLKCPYQDLHDELSMAYYVISTVMGDPLPPELQIKIQRLIDANNKIKI